MPFIVKFIPTVCEGTVHMAAYTQCGVVCGADGHTKNRIVLTQALSLISYD